MHGIASCNRRAALVIMLVAAIFCSGCGARGPAAGAETIAIRNVVIVGPQASVRNKTATVVVRGTRIQWVGHAEEAPPTTRTIDGTGGYLIPGLWDMHAHLTEITADSLPLLVANRVTGVRDMGSDLNDVRRWQRDINDGTLVGPRIVTAGPKLDGEGQPAPDRRIVRTPEDGRIAVAQLAANRVDFIKIHSAFDRERFQAVVDEAARHGLPVAGHLPDGVRVIDAARAGMSSLEHFSGFPLPCPADLTAVLQATRWSATRSRCVSPAESEALFAELRATNTWLTPTLVSYRGLAYIFGANEPGSDRSSYAVPTLRASWERNAKAIPEDVKASPADFAVWRRLLAMNPTLTVMAARAGNRLLAGTDAGNPYVAPGFDLLGELELMTAAGVPPVQALYAATAGPAEFLGKSSDLGTIEPGRIADMVLLDANPVEDITNVRRIRAVIANGRPFDRDALDHILQKAGPSAQRSAAAGSPSSTTTASPSARR